MNEKIYGTSEDSWPYDCLMDSLVFFSMSQSARDEYLQSCDTKLLNEYPVQEIRNAIIQGFAQHIVPALEISDWINDEDLERLNLEVEFKALVGLGMNRGTDEILSNWESISEVSSRLLTILGWREVTSPFTDASEMMMQYESHDMGDGWGWQT